MTQIAIIGTKSSGKTTLVSVLAKHIAAMVSKKAILLPADYATGKSVTAVCEHLNSGQWWEGTAQGTKTQLRFKLHVNSDDGKSPLEIPVELIDSAGEDLRHLFVEDRHKTLIQDKHLAGLLQYIQASSIIMLIVNLQDFAGQPDGLKRYDNQTVLKEVVEMFAKNDKHQEIIICFTAGDLYDEYIKEEFDGDIRKYVRQELPELYNAARLCRAAGNNLYLHKVSAVADTQSGFLEDGRPTRLPKPGFKSTGLNELTERIVQSVQRVTLPYPLTNHDAWEWEYTCIKGFFSCRKHRATAKIPVKNAGGAGNITVEFSLNGKSNSQTEYFRADETKYVIVTIPGLPNHRKCENGKINCFRTK